jgi:copper chaperone CopZ
VDQLPGSEALGAHPSAVTILVTGMHCGSCVALIQEVLADTPGVRSVAVELEAATARVELDPSEVSADDLCAVVVDLGYGASVQQ